MSNNVPESDTEVVSKPKRPSSMRILSREDVIESSNNIEKETFENINDANHFNFNMSGLFEDYPFVKNCGISLIIGKNETLGQQKLLQLFL